MSAVIIPCLQYSRYLRRTASLWNPDEPWSKGLGKHTALDRWIPQIFDVDVVGISILWMQKPLQDLWFNPTKFGELSPGGRADTLREVIIRLTRMDNHKSSVDILFARDIP
jgi:hypothetical protein